MCDATTFLLALCCLLRATEAFLLRLTNWQLKGEGEVTPKNRPVLAMTYAHRIGIAPTSMA